MNSQPCPTGIRAELARRLPTPVTECRGVGMAGLWLKNDGLTGERYGGNKLRKLAPILEHAVRRQKRRLLTVGAAGSHHLLATTLYARDLGLEVTAFVAPQFHTPHAETVFRCSVGLGLDVLPTTRPATWWQARRHLTRDTLWIGPGAMGEMGAYGYALAALELAGQVGRGELPEPESIVVAVGSGSTAAGLLAGLTQTRLASRVVGVPVAFNPATRPMIIGQAEWVAAKHHFRTNPRELHQRLELRNEYVGGGYGRPTAAGADATSKARSVGLELDPTYTAKAFAAALAENLRGSPILYWHTLSATPMALLLATAPAASELPGDWRALLRANPRGVSPNSVQAL